MTFTRDVTDRSELDAPRADLATEVTRSVVAEGRVVTHVAVKLRTATLLHPHQDQQAAGADDRPGGRRPGPLVVLDRFELDRPVRLLGVRVVLDEV